MSDARPAPPTAAGATDVAVNLLWCVPGEVGGSEEYLVRQLIGLAAQPAGLVPRLYCTAGFVAAHPELAELYPIVTAPFSGVDRRRRIVGEHTWLWRRTRSAALVHHAGGTAPRWGRRPTVVTLHDLQWLTFPDFFAPTKLGYLRTVVPRALRAAAVVTVPTEYVKRTVVEAFGVVADRIVVVPHGVEPTLGASAPDAYELRRDYGLGSGPVLVFPAITHPHKGHDFLLELMASQWTDPDLRLVLLGGEGLGEVDVVTRIEQLGLGDRVVRPGRVPAAHRDGLIQLADALVFPSRYEGFGAPVVEAMALGTPVICSDQQALAEVAGGAALSAPLQVDAWAPLLGACRDRRAELVAAGHRRATEFTAARSGAALAAAYRLALGLEPDPSATGSSS